MHFKPIFTSYYGGTLDIQYWSIRAFQLSLKSSHFTDTAKGFSIQLFECRIFPPESAISSHNSAVGVAIITHLSDGRLKSDFIAWPSDKIILGFMEIKYSVYGVLYWVFIEKYLLCLWINIWCLLRGNIKGKY